MKPEIEATSNKGVASSNKKLLVAPGITTRNKKLPGTRASLVVTTMNHHKLLMSKVERMAWNTVNWPLCGFTTGLE